MNLFLGSHWILRTHTKDRHERQKPAREAEDPTMEQRKGLPRTMMVVSPGEPGSRPGEQPEGQKALEGCLPVKR
jgi:hypothetical protein